MSQPEARVVFIVHVPNERQSEFLSAYEEIRFAVADGVSGHVADEICQSDTDPEKWLITSTWHSLDDFRTWEQSPEHRELVAPLSRCFTQASSQRFHVHARTSSRFAEAL